MQQVKNQLLTSPHLTDEEQRIIEWALHDKWKCATEAGDMDLVLCALGWIYFNAAVLSGEHPFKGAMPTLAKIKQNGPEIFKGYFDACKRAHAMRA